MAMLVVGALIPCGHERQEHPVLRFLLMFVLTVSAAATQVFLAIGA
jgi:hypothetical protein